MPQTTSRAKLQEFLGMVTWLAPFIPNMSENTATLRELLRQDTEFIWNESYDAAFQRIKQLIAVMSPSNIMMSHAQWKSTSMLHSED